MKLSIPKKTTKMEPYTSIAHSRAAFQSHYAHKVELSIGCLGKESTS